MRHLKTGCFIVLGAVLAACGNTLVDHMADMGIKPVGPSGGTVRTSFGVEMAVPPGALETEQLLTISAAADLPEGALTPVEIGPTGTQFAVPVTLAFKYPASTPRPELLKVMTVVNGKWQALTGHRFDPATRTVYGTTSHLSPYGLVASAEACGNAKDDDGDGLSDCSDPACNGDPACPAASCTTNKDCASNRFCFNGRCAATGACHANADCDANYFCLANQCAAAGSCLSSAQCGNGEECDGGTCRRTCKASSECGAAEICRWGYCKLRPSDYCTQDADCAAGQACVYESCMPKPICTSPNSGSSAMNCTYVCKDCACESLEISCDPSCQSPGSDCLVQGDGKGFVEFSPLLPNWCSQIACVTPTAANDPWRCTASGCKGTPSTTGPGDPIVEDTLSCPVPPPTPEQGAHCVARCKNCDCTEIQYTCDKACYASFTPCFINADPNGTITNLSRGVYPNGCTTMSCAPENDLSADMSCTGQQCIIGVK